jgi:hypothetical protein
MKVNPTFFIYLFVVLFSSCSNKDSLCHKEESIEALKLSLTESVVEQSEFLTREYGPQNVEAELEDLFKEGKIQISSIDAMHTKVIDSMLVCTCSARITFKEEEEFLNFIAPKISEAESSDDKYSRLYLKNKHLIEYRNKGYFPFFFSVFETRENLSASANDYKVGSLLIEYLRSYSI